MKKLILHLLIISNLSALSVQQISKVMIKNNCESPIEIKQDNEFELSCIESNDIKLTKLTCIYSSKIICIDNNTSKNYILNLKSVKKTNSIIFPNTFGELIEIKYKTF